jgi:hypothetical protein
MGLPVSFLSFLARRARMTSLRVSRRMNQKMEMRPGVVDDLDVEDPSPRLLIVDLDDGAADEGPQGDARDGREAEKGHG